MRIIIIGQQAFGKAVLEALLERGEEIVAVYAPVDKPDRRPDPLTEAAREHGLKLLQPTSYKNEEVWEECRALKPDVGMMAFVTLFVPEEFLNVPTHGTFQYHPSLLPLHRGPSSINWPIMWGANKTGLSIFWPNDGLDEGEILLQKEVDIGPDDTLGDVYFKKIFPLGIDTVLEAVDLVRAGNPPRIAQDDSKATYDSWCKKEHGEIDWNRSVGEVYNQIRATNPAPGAWTTFDGKVLQIFDCARVEAAGRPGEVVSITDEGITVVAGLGGILIKRVRYDGGAKVAAKEFVSAGRLTKGALLCK